METPRIEQLNIKCPSCHSTDKTRKDFDFPQTMACCDNCGCDFMIDDGEIILNPVKA